MQRGRRHKATSLFLLRVWPEKATDGHAEWCGKIHNVASDEVHLFRDLTTLNAILLEMLPDLEIGKHLLSIEDGN